MSGGYAQPWAADEDPAVRRRRAVSLSVTVALHALVLFLLLRFVAHPNAPEAKGTSPLIVNLQPETRAPSPSPQTPHVAQAKLAPAAARQAPAAAKPPPPPEAPPTPNVKLDIVQVSHEDFVGGDISKLPSHKAELASADQGTGAGPHQALAGPGEGPGGSTLYPADWYRRPTNAELGTYVKPGAPEGSGVIKCKTEPGYKVDQCEIVGETPPGSGLARAVLNAAWQFRVLPVRINGRPQIGAWVEIEITYEHGVVDLR